MLDYSTDDNVFTEMFTVSADQDDQSYQSYELPENISGTVYIRLTDTDSTPGNRELDTVYIDHMYIRTILQPGNPPSAPSDLVAATISASQIDLSWIDNADNELGFTVERAVSGEGFSEVASLGPNTTSFSDSGLISDTQYIYRVYAHNSSGNSEYSDVAEATTEPGSSMHIGNLEGFASWEKNKWQATAEVYVHDENHNPVMGALVSGTWSNGADGTGSCTTDVNGLCPIIKSGIKSNVNSVTFTVDSVTLSGYTYVKSNNHDPDGNSDGTTITIIS
jgi:hypothetical protein